MIPRPCGTVIKTDWTPEKTSALMTLVADGLSFGRAGKVLGVTKNSALGRFERVRAAMGWQCE